VRAATLAAWSVLSFAGTLALLVVETDAAFAVIPAVIVLLAVTPFVRLDRTPWAVLPPLAALALWSSSAPGFYVHGVLGASVCALLYGLVLVVRFTVLGRRMPLSPPAKRAWLWSLALGIVVAVVSLGGMPLELRFRLSEDAMTRTARDVVDGRRDPDTIARIGLWNVAEAERIPGGMRFIVEDAGLFDRHGFAYTATGIPPERGRYYRDGWYLWDNGFEL
jgi:hypothetical protein